MLDNERFGKRLVKAGVITQEQLDEALHHQELQEGRLGEILVRLGYVSESTILQFLAAEFRTRYVSTERLARARIPQQVLDLLAVHLAERYNLIPVLYDAETSTLSIVTSEPQNEENLREVHMLTSVRELRVYVALQPAVQAAIRKHYRGEINAFKDLLYQSASPIPNMPANPYEATHNPNAIDGYTDGYDANAYQQQALPGTDQSAYPGYPANAQNPNLYENYQYNNNNNYNDYDNNPPPASPPYYDINQYENRPDLNYNYNTELPPSYVNPHNNYPYDDGDEVTRLHPGPYANYEQDPGHQEDPNFAPIYSPQLATGLEPMAPVAEVSPLAQVQVLDLTRVLVTQLQQLHPRYQLHLERQRPLLQAILRRLFSPKDSQPIWLAFYLHHIDLPDPLPTLLNMSTDDALHQQCKAEHHSRMQRLHYLHLPEETMEILQHAYERADGNGFPNGLLRQDIPLGARLLAILDAFEQLQHAHQGPSAKKEKLDNNAILTKLREHENTLFDPKLLDIFKEELPRIDKYQRGEIAKIMLLEPNTESIQDLEKILWDRNFWVYLVNHPGEAEEICQRESIDLIVLEVTLPGDRDGFLFAEHIKETIENPPDFIFHTNRDSQDELDRGMSLARDYLIKPQGANVMATKLNKQIQQLRSEKAIRRKAADPKQLSGSLEQLGLAELIQFLSQGRRTGRVTIESGKETGHIFLDQGQVINAILNQEKGEGALYNMMVWEKGTFSLNPSITTEERLIHKHTDGLLLDLLRIMDESRRDGIEDPFANQGGDENDESSFFDLSFDESDEDQSTKQIEEVDTSNEKPKKKGSGLFGDIADDDLDDVFSSSFKDASRDNLAAKGKKPL